MNIIDTPLDNFSIFLRSSEYTQSINNLKSNLIFELNQSINKYNDMDFVISLESFHFTNSFYTINDNNRYLYYSFYQIGTPYTMITLNNGNYDIDSLTTYLNSAMTGFVFTYNSMLMKFTVTNDNPFRFVNPVPNVNNAYEMIGFDDYGTTTLLNTITSPYVVNLMTTQILHICIPNLNFTSIGLKNKQRRHILGSIHIDTIGGESQSFNNPSNFKYKINDNVISFLNVVIYDQDFNIVDFNNIDWFLQLSVQIVYKPELKIPKYLDDNAGLGEFQKYIQEEENRNLIQLLTSYLQNQPK